eukprot:CAMPEP_0171241816 /NCGR_PEP_ID=MMETSP0790-20130122/45305_1 /TAXON_ID=2925 /ORGANISM="Alexandrium catenella, Strain OF101" /LENGTH=171 /DNA_ID=CAMNT_0011708467 /DNA_START=215 /DNA_END=731 /DNA_ORIENTATION=-
MAPVEGQISCQSRAASPPPRKSVSGKAGAEEAASKENAGVNTPHQQAKASAGSPEQSVPKTSVKQKVFALPRLRIAMVMSVLVLAMLAAFFAVGGAASVLERGNKVFAEGMVLAAQRPMVSAVAVAMPLLLGGTGLAVRKVASRRAGGQKAPGKVAEAASGAAVHFVSLAR